MLIITATSAVYGPRGLLQPDVIMLDNIGFPGTHSKEALKPKQSNDMLLGGSRVGQLVNSPKSRAAAEAQISLVF